jgi:chromate reductase
MTGEFALLAVVGSLRKDSLNRALMNAYAELAPAGVVVEDADISQLPLYDADRDGPHAPAPVTEFRRRIVRADALLLITPEYNWGPSGVIKNAVDWASLPAHGSPLEGKPIALAGASAGPAGTGRAQMQLRQNLHPTRALVLAHPDVLVPFARERFGQDGRLLDEPTRQVIAEQIRALVTWAHRHRPHQIPPDLVAQGLPLSS